MTKCLALISLLLLSFLPATLCAQEESADATQYGVVIDARGREFTGIFLMAESEEGHVVGAVVNEMGVKAFDFTFDGKKAKVQNLFPPINKWYIRRVLRKDIAFLLTHLKARTNTDNGKRSLNFLPDGTIELKNQYRITYRFNLLEDKP